MNKLFKFLKWARIICLIVVICAWMVNTVQAFKAESRYEAIKNEYECIKEECNLNGGVELITGDFDSIETLIEKNKRLNEVVDKGDEVLEAEDEMYDFICSAFLEVVLFWMIVSIDIDEKLFGLEEEK